LPLAKSLEEFANQNNLQLSFGAYEVLLKLSTSAGDLHAMDVCERVTSRFPYFTDGLCAGRIARCAEQKFLVFAERLASVMRSRGQMTVMTYSALMKVYSYCNKYSEACDLYHQLLADGLEPDSTMYGCLMKFSAECGRTDLTRELSAKMPCNKLGVHHHMSLIRAAGQDKDVEKAFTVLAQFREAGGLDTAVCNAVLDVCCAVRDMERACRLVTEMRKDGLLDIISFNTLIKGYCMLGDSTRATQVLTDMEKSGFQPNDITYNCLINMAASAGDFRAAWKTISTMESKSVRIDHYTVSTLLKALKRAPAGKGDIGRVLDLLDRHHIDICCEEVLLNTALEACVKHGEHRRLESLLDNGSIKSGAGTQLAPHTYANLIKAAGVLKRLQQCRDLWIEMTEVRCIQPTGVALGCMLDALVCNGRVTEGVALFRKWHGRVEANTVLYSTLIKGFNNIGDTKGAVEMWDELSALKLPMNAMVYNAIIDVHARVGATAEITKLLQTMEGDKVEPDGITKSIVAKGFCMSGELDKAVEVLRGLPHNTNNVIVYNTVLDGCVRHNRMELADELLANMQSFNVVPTNFTLGIMVKMWGRRRKLGEAFKAVRTLPKQYGFTPNTPVKTCLLFACLRNDAVTGALEVFDDLKSIGHRADSKMFSALINNCAKVGQAERALSLVEEAYGLSSGKRVLPQSEHLENACLEQLMKCLSKQGEMQRLGVALVKKMTTQKIPVSPNILAMTVDKA
jgi:pentatricopeptide repeat protein